MRAHASTINNRRARMIGFSLIELLVVIAIIAILAGIVLPVLHKARGRGTRIACIHNLTQMGKALRMYLTDWKGVMPFRQAAPPWSSDAGWTARLKAYNDAIDIFHCPSDSHYFSYGMNAQAMSRAAPPAGLQGDTNRAFREAAVVSATKLIVIYEAPGSGDRGGNLNDGDSDITSDIGNAVQTDGDVYGGQPQRNDDEPITGPVARARYNYLYFPGRHDGGNNLLFFDGHAKWFRDWDEHQMTFDPGRRPL